jgi:hypothetical protein
LGRLEGCCKLQNVYQIYEGPYIKDKKLEDFNLIAQMNEQSECCERCFCEPFQSLRLEVSFPDTGLDNPQFTMERPGICQGKCGLCCCACADCCIDEMTLYEGAIHPKSEYRDPANSRNAIMTCRQAPATESMFNPMIIASQSDSKREISRITGPCCFGGCSELCFTSEFDATANGAQIGSVNKIRPDGCCSMCMEVCTTSDRYTVNFGSSNNEQKVALFTSMFLTDMMLFENDHALCGCRENHCYIHLCNAYCCGCLVPLKLIIPTKRN